MEYIIPVVLVLLGGINLNLIRVALQTGTVQSRFFNFEKDKEKLKFYISLVFQGGVSLVCFAAAFFRVAYGV